MASPRAQARSTTISVLALVEHFVAGLGPNVEVSSAHTVARCSGRTQELDGSTSCTIGTSALPVIECHVVEKHSISRIGGNGAPVAVDVEGVGVRVSDEVVE